MNFLKVRTPWQILEAATASGKLKEGLTAAREQVRAVARVCGWVGRGGEGSMRCHAIRTEFSIHFGRTG